jgi:hypothetical protein
MCYLCHVCLSMWVCESVKTPIRQISLKFDIGDSHENLLRKSKFGSIQAEIVDTLHENHSMFYYQR